MNQITSSTIVRLMRQNHKTIRGLAASMNITRARVRYIRANGVHGAAFVTDWLEAITAR